MNIGEIKYKKLRRPSPFLGAFAAVAVMALLLFAYMAFKPVTMMGSKTISVEVLYQDKTADRYTVTTEAQYLKEALDAIPELTIEGPSTEEFGMMMVTVGGVRADYEKDGAYWALLFNGEPCNYGISRQPIKDGESYQIVYTPAGQ